MWGFRLEEIFRLWGGQEQVAGLCRSCPANAAPDPLVNGELAGCCGWLGEAGNPDGWKELVERSWPAPVPAGIPETRPRWYGLWALRTLQGPGLAFAIRLFASAAQDDGSLGRAARNFHQVLVRGREYGLAVDVDLVPPGFNDGQTWTIGRHCNRCRAVRSGRSHVCAVCGARGAGHPEIKRKVLGRRPWIALETLVGGEEAGVHFERISQDTSAGTEQRSAAIDPDPGRSGDR